MHDAQGFLLFCRKDPAFKLYIDRSLLKDYDQDNVDIGSGKDTGMAATFFAEWIVHEAAATVAAKYAVSRPDHCGDGTTPDSEVSPYQRTHCSHLQVSQS
jgi:hypothetical protein